MTRPRYVMDFERELVELEEKVERLRRMDIAANPDLAVEIDTLSRELMRLHDETYLHLQPWDRVQIARHPERPHTEAYVAALFGDVIELHGDRYFGDDQAIFAGLGTIASHKVVVLGHNKGTDTKSNIARNFGSAHPEGFRKAIRAMRMADKFGLPIVSFLDTAGAYPGIEAEERGQGWAIAEALATLADVRAPVVAVGIGEGGSGGALAIGFGDRLFMLENAYYSVISPESCASILYRDAGEATTAASCLKMTAEDLTELGIVDDIIAEPAGGAHRDPELVFNRVGTAIVEALDELAGMSGEELVASRYAKLRAIGVFTDE